MHAAWVEPHEKRLLVPVSAIDKVERGLEEFLVNRLHTFLCQRAGVLAFLFAPFAEAWVFARGFGGGRRTLQNSPRTKARLKRRIFRIIRIFRFVLGVQVIEISEKLVEPVNRRQKLIAVAEMVFAELCRRISGGLSRSASVGSFSDRPSFAPVTRLLGDRFASGSDR